MGTYGANQVHHLRNTMKPERTHINGLQRPSAAAFGGFPGGEVLREVHR